MSTAIAKNLMAEMKLLGMFAAFDQNFADATRDQTSYIDFLDGLLQAESDYRQERKLTQDVKRMDMFLFYYRCRSHAADTRIVMHVAATDSANELP